MININNTNYSAKCGDLILELLRKNGIFISTDCGGRKKCGKCKLKCYGSVSAPTTEELDFLSREEIKNNVRLACMCRVEGDCTVITEENEIKGEVALSCASNEGEYSIACDIGTTTIAISLCRGMNAISSKLFENPQRLFSADVIGRINYINEDGEKLYSLKKILTDKINSAIIELCLEEGIRAENIKKAAFAGNTVMQHIFCNISPFSIGRAPYIPKTLFGDFRENLELVISPAASVYLSPCLAAYIGGDITAGLIYARLDMTRKLSLYIDIGTNGEMALIKNGEFYFCSTAAGPALEGAHIKMGSSAKSGAINSVQLIDGKIVCRTVDGAPPLSICGSGIIDITALLVENDICDETGRLCDEDKVPELFKKRICNNEFLLENGVVFTAQDIREVQLAKGAIAAGILTLCKKCGVKPQEIENITMAGSFGCGINITSAQKMGLLPFDVTKIERVPAGNASAKGAVLMASEKEARERAEKIIKNAEYIELSGNADFSDFFMDCMMF